MIHIDLLMGSIVALLLIVIGVALVVRAVKAQRRKALEQQLEKEQQAGQALVRYVQLNRQCSEEKAYERLATFVKRRGPFEDHDYNTKMVASKRLCLLECARSVLVDDPDEIDKI